MYENKIWYTLIRKSDLSVKQQYDEVVWPRKINYNVYFKVTSQVYKN